MKQLVSIVNKMNDMSTDDFHIDIADVLDRVGVICEEKTDTGIAKQLGVTRQAITNARKRGTIPYEKLCLFAVKHKITIDYLLIGLGDGARLDGEVDPYLFRDIMTSLYDKNESTQHFRDTVIINGIDAVSYYAARIYNKIIKNLVPGDDWSTLVESEVCYLLEIKLDRNLDKEKDQSIKVQKEFQKDHKDQITHNNHAGTEDTTCNVTQHIQGDSHQIAGRDVINKKRTKKNK